MKFLKLHIFASSDDPQSLGNTFREKRFNFFKNKIESLPKPVKIIDIGGEEKTWINGSLANNNNYQITLLNLGEFAVKSSNIKSVIGDATNLAVVSDKAFDVVFSNSVIEHLYTAENQRKMASEVTRIGIKYYIQTPNKYFPVESHYFLPFFQFVPKKLVYFILTKTRLSRGKYWPIDLAREYVNQIILLSKKDLKELFPGSKIYSERFFGMDKSFTAHNF